MLNHNENLGMLSICLIFHQKSGSVCL